MRWFAGMMWSLVVLMIGAVELAEGHVRWGAFALATGATFFALAWSSVLRTKVSPDRARREIAAALGEFAPRLGFVKSGDVWRHPSNVAAFLDGDRLAVDGFPAITLAPHAAGDPGTRLLTGDPAFDDDVCVRPDGAETRARFVGPARVAARALLFSPWRVELAASRFVLGIPPTIPLSTTYGLRAAVHDALALAVALASQQGFEGLVALAQSDRAPGVRAAALAELADLARPGTEAAVRAALDRGRSDPDPRVRVQALLRLLPDRDPAVARELVSAAFAPEVAAGAGAQALRAARALPRTERVEVLVRALATPALAAEAVRAMEALRWPEFLPAVAGLLDAQGPLRSAAIATLGRIGLTDVVPSLRMIAGRSGEDAQAAEEAIARIQARSAGADPGQLSAAEGGELSETLEAGTLAIAVREKLPR